MSGNMFTGSVHVCIYLYIVNRNSYTFIGTSQCVQVIRTHKPTSV